MHRPEAHVQREIASQPDCWARALQSAGEAAKVLPARGERVAVIGCGTSWHIASAIASAREAAGHGETDAFTASELPARDYDAVLAVTRSGTTAEVLDALRNLRGRARRIGITADAATPISEVTDQLLVLDYADEQSVVQTRFATTVLTVARAHIGHDLGPVDRAGAGGGDGRPRRGAARPAALRLPRPRLVGRDRAGGGPQGPGGVGVVERGVPVA